MIVTELEVQLIEDLFKYSQNEVMTPANLGIIKSGKQNELVNALDNINVNKLINLTSREQYDDWFDEVVEPFHDNLMPVYRDNLTVTEENPYSYSARLLNHYVRILCVRTWLFGHSGELFIRIQHPKMTNTFLKSFPEIDASRVNQIKSREEYYDIVKYYRELIDKDPYEENKPLLEMELGVDF